MIRCVAVPQSHNLISYHSGPSGRDHHQAEASAIVTSFGEPGLIYQRLRHPCSPTPSTTAAGSWGHPPTAAGRGCGRSMSLWTLLQAILMLVNGVAILNNDRFLEKYGWGFSQMQASNSLKMSIIGGIHAVTYFRAFLLPINCIVIIAKMISG